MEGNTDLKVGDNVIKVIGVAEDGTTEKVYTVVAKRAADPDAEPTDTSADDTTAIPDDSTTSDETTEPDETTVSDTDEQTDKPSGTESASSATKILRVVAGLIIGIIIGFVIGKVTSKLAAYFHHQVDMRAEHTIKQRKDPNTIPPLFCVMTGISMLCGESPLRRSYRRTRKRLPRLVS